MNTQPQKPDPLLATVEALFLCPRTARRSSRILEATGSALQNLKDFLHEGRFIRACFLSKVSA